MRIRTVTLSEPTLYINIFIANKTPLKLFVASLTLRVLSYCVVFIFNFYIYSFVYLVVLEHNVQDFSYRNLDGILQLYKKY